MHHYTDSDGFKAIGSQPTWTFLASKPPCEHPVGAYFTTLGPETLNLAKRLRIPRRKTEFRFEFTGDSGLTPLEGGRGGHVRGGHVFFSRVDYLVDPSRHVFSGESVP